tara:strand:+ start:258 stop:470 length:213 start_codon:yes stop_codon:yes gene_type:complete
MEIIVSDWETQILNLQKTLDEIKDEVKENRAEIQELKQELATGKGSIRAVMWIGGIIGIVYTLMKIIKFQ